MALALTACKTPVTVDPDFTQDELRSEQAAQARAATKAPLYFNAKKNYGYKQIDALDARVKPVALRVQHAASQLCEDLQHTQPQTDDAANCVFTAIMNPHEHSLNAHADGKMAVINPAMVDFLKSNDQLAFVLSHEMAHNVMQHLAKQQNNADYGMAFGLLGDVVAGAARVNSKGAFSKMGSRTAALAYSPEFEAEADYVGLYIMARAGYKIEEAPDVWRMMSQAQPDAIYVTRTHPNNPARVIAMTKNRRRNPRQATRAPTARSQYSERSIGVHHG